MFLKLDPTVWGVFRALCDEYQAPYGLTVERLLRDAVESRMRQALQDLDEAQRNPSSVLDDQLRYQKAARTIARLQSLQPTEAAS